MLRRARLCGLAATHQLRIANAGGVHSDEGNEVNLSQALGDRDYSLATLGLDGDKQVGCSIPHVLVVLLGWAGDCHAQRRAAVIYQLQVFLVNANEGFRFGHGSRTVRAARTYALGTLGSVPWCTTLPGARA